MNLILFLIILLISLSIVKCELPPIIREWYPKQDNCTVLAPQCVPIPDKLKKSCLGNPLPYEMTSNSPLTEDVPLFDLNIWSTLRAVPACWDKLQFFLCAVYVPECREERSRGGGNASLNARVVLPEEGMCRAVHRACPLLFTDQLEDINNRQAALAETSQGTGLLGQTIPRFLQCDNYASGCRNKLRTRIYEVNRSDCQAPLVYTTNHRNWIKGIATCSFPCRRPIFRDEDYSLARNITLCASVFGIIVNSFVLLTLRLLRGSGRRVSLVGREDRFAFELKHRSSNRITAMSHTGPHYSPHHRSSSHQFERSRESLQRLPYTALAYIHSAFLIGCCGWLLPHIPPRDVIGDAIVCRKDGSLRVGEPQITSESSALCVLAFVLVYFPMLAAILWSNVFDYAIFSIYQSLAARVPRRRQGLRTHSTGVERRASRFVWMKPSDSVISTTCRPLIPPDSVKLAKKWGNGKKRGDVNSAMEESSIPSPSLTTARLNIIENPVAGGSPNPVGLSAIEPDASTPSSNQPDQPPINSQWIRGDAEECWEDNSAGRHHPLTCCLIEGNCSEPDTLNDNILWCYEGKLTDASNAVFKGSLPMGAQLTCIHLIVLAVALVFTLVCLAASELDGEPLSGLCFVGVRSLWAHCALVIAPLAACLLIKGLLLVRSAWCMLYLRRVLSTSHFRVDREMAHRLLVCIRAYVIYIIALTTLFGFFIGVHFYVFLGEPTWLESQRLFIFCQLRYRLMGLDAGAASVACHSTSPELFSALRFGGGKLQPPQTPIHPPISALLLQHNTTPHAQYRLRRSSGGEGTGDSSFSSSPHASLYLSPNILHHPTTSAQRPLTGPLFLNLLTFFGVNLVFASMCLLDGTVKQRWTAFVYRRVTQLGSLCRRKTSLVLQSDVNASTMGDGKLSLEGISHAMCRDSLPPTFSWWDPGVFFLVSLRPTVPPLPTALSVPPISAASTMAPVLPVAAFATTTSSSSSNCIDATAVKLRGSGMDSVSCSCSRRYSSSTNDESCIVQTVSSMGCISPTVSVHSEKTNRHRLPTATCPLPLQKSSSVNSSQSLFLRCNNQHHHQSATNSQAALQQAVAAVLAGNPIPPDFGLEEAIAAVALQKSMTRSGRRGHNRRLFAGKTAGVRRRLASRSLSTTGLGPTSAYSTVATDQLFQSVLRSAATAASANDVTGRNGVAVVGGAANHQPDALTAASLSWLLAMGAGGGARKRTSSSVFGESQVSAAQSSTSAASTATEIVNSSTAAVAAADILRRRLSALTSRGVGRDSRLSLRSLAAASSASCLSQFAAESYNSFQLMAEQTEGAGWRELWRTRMLLMDVLQWAHTVEQQQQAAQQCQQQSPDWASQLSSMMTAYFMAAGGGGGPVSTPDQQAPTSPGCVDPVMMAALIAATAAAQAAMQQQQTQNPPTITETKQAEIPRSQVLQQQQLVNSTARGSRYQHEAPQMQSPYNVMSPRVGPPDLVADHHRVRQCRSGNENVCHLDAGPSAASWGMRTPVGFPSPVMSVSAWCPIYHPQQPQWGQPSLNQSASSVAQIPPTWAPIPQPHVQLHPPAFIASLAVAAPAVERGSGNSDDFDSEDEVMSEKGGHKDREHDDEEEEEFLCSSSNFPLPDGQPPPDSDWLLTDIYSSSEEEEMGCIGDGGDDDVSSVSQSASQVVRPSTSPKKSPKTGQKPDLVAPDNNLT